MSRIVLLFTIEKAEKPIGEPWEFNEGESTSKDLFWSAY